MEYLKMKNLLDDTTNKRPKFETRDWVWNKWWTTTDV